MLRDHADSHLVVLLVAVAWLIALGFVGLLVSGLVLAVGGFGPSLNHNL